MADEVERAKRFGHDAGPDHARHRQLQARQRHLRPPAGRPRAARGGARAARVLARDRRARPLRRRGDGGRAARRPTSRAPTSSPSACASAIEALELPLLDGDGTLRVTASFGAAALPGSARRRQGRAGRRGRRRAVPREALGQEPHRQGRSRLLRARWDCSTTPSASTSSSSAAGVRTPRRSRARSTRRSGPPQRGEFAERDAAPTPARRRRSRGRRAAAGRSRRPSRPPRAEPSPSRAEPEPEPERRASARRARGRRSELDEPRGAARGRADGRVGSRRRSPTRGRADAGRGEDVLEETPDFLQETPEHDRLWFEQKPPRDFDFDRLSARRTATPGWTSSPTGRCRATGSRSSTTPTALADATMLAFARETRLSETSFVQTADGDGADYRHRIFMMSGEMPFAGHPSLGTAVAVARARGEAQRRPTCSRPQPGCSRSTSSSTATRAARLDAAGAAGVRRRARPRRRARRSSASTAPTPTPRCRCRSSRPASPQVIAPRARRRRAAPRRCPTTTASGALLAEHDGDRRSTSPRVDPAAGTRARALVPAHGRDGRGPGDRLGRRPADAPTCARAHGRRAARDRPGRRDGPAEPAGRLAGGRPRARGRRRRRSWSRGPSTFWTPDRFVARGLLGRAARADQQIRLPGHLWTGTDPAASRLGTPGRGTMPDDIYASGIPPAPGRAFATAGSARAA